MDASDAVRRNVEVMRGGAFCVVCACIRQHDAMFGDRVDGENDNRPALIVPSYRYHSAVNMSPLAAPEPRICS